MHIFIFILLSIFGLSGLIFIILKYIRSNLLCKMFKNVNWRYNLPTCTIYFKINCIEKIQSILISIWLFCSLFIFISLMTNNIQFHSY